MNAIMPLEGLFFTPADCLKRETRRTWVYVTVYECEDFISRHNNQQWLFFFFIHTWSAASGLNKHGDLIYSPDSQLFAVRFNGKATNKDGSFHLADTVDSACSMCRSLTRFLFCKPHISFLLMLQQTTSRQQASFQCYLQSFNFNSPTCSSFFCWNDK